MPEKTFLFGGCHAGKEVSFKYFLISFNLDSNSLSNNPESASKFSTIHHVPFL